MNADLKTNVQEKAQGDTDIALKLAAQFEAVRRRDSRERPALGWIAQR